MTSYLAFIPTDASRLTPPHRVLSPSWRLWATWLVTRVGALALLPINRETRVLTDVLLYHTWSLDLWNHHRVPGHDFSWEYPPGSLLLIAMPHAIADKASYTFAFALEILVIDAFVLGYLQRRTRRTQEHTGAWIWVLAAPALGPLVVARLDAAPTALCLLAVGIAARRPARSGALLAGAVLVKLWPVVVLVAVSATQRSRRALIGGFTAALAVGLSLAVLLGVSRSLLTSLKTQEHRGVQAEALAALPWLWGKVCGGDVHIVVRLSATDIDSSAATVVATVASVAGGIAVLALCLKTWSRQAIVSTAPLTLPAAVVGLMLLTNKVLSPQYLLWLIGLAALALTERGRFQRALPIALVTCASLTHAVFPLQYDALLLGRVEPLVLLTLRDAGLIAVVVMLVLRTLTSGVTGRAEVSDSAPGPARR
jgi:hypothetical protein